MKILIGDYFSRTLFRGEGELMGVNITLNITFNIGLNKKL